MTERVDPERVDPPRRRPPTVAELLVLVEERVLEDDVAVLGHRSEVAVHVEERPPGGRLERVVVGGLRRNPALLAAAGSSRRFK